MADFPDDRELLYTRFIAAPRASVWRCWTDPELLSRWFAPAPHVVIDVELDVRPGGGTDVTMQAPDGQEMQTKGVYLEVVSGVRLVFTDAFEPGWRPRDGAAFMVVTIELEDQGRGTLYTALARHWCAESTRRHEAMGFHGGWLECGAQLARVAATVDVRSRTLR
jgi:uncharacterized protein YndB with AHSA1/START domain